jgi:MFS family permease
MGLVTAASGGGSLLAGLVSGALVDRVDRRRLMIACDCVRAALWTMVPLVFAYRGPTLWLLYLAVALSGCFGNVFHVACITAIPSLVRREQIIDANGRLHATYALMNLLGPMLSGVVCHRFGPLAALGVNAASFLASATSLAGVRAPATRGAAAPPPRGRAAARELLAGAAFLVREPVMRAFTLLLVCSSVLTAAKRDLLSTTSSTRCAATTARWGCTSASRAPGRCLGALSAPRARRRWGLGAWWLACGAVLGARWRGSGSRRRSRGPCRSRVASDFADASRAVVAADVSPGGRAGAPCSGA